MIRLMAAEVRAKLAEILEGRGASELAASKVALEMTRNSLEGVYTHGINRFPRLVESIDLGQIRVGAGLSLLGGFGGFENYDGNLGFGIINAWAAMERAIELAGLHGLGLVAVRNTNHWLRAATYGHQACEAGMAGFCVTNTRPNMPSWGASDARLGNNPLVFAFPFRDGDIVVDTALSQYSYGALEKAVLEGRQMPFPAGFDALGKPTCDPATVLETRRSMPAGYWKGAALSFVLDVVAAALSRGNTVGDIGKLGDEFALSQVFLAIDYKKIVPQDEAEAIARRAVDNLRASAPDGSGAPIVYPGQRLRATRAKNEAEGIPVDERIWDKILGL